MPLGVNDEKCFPSGLKVVSACEAALDPSSDDRVDDCTVEISVPFGVGGNLAFAGG